MSDQLLLQLKDDFSFEGEAAVNGAEFAGFFSEGFIKEACEKVGYSSEVKEAFVNSLPLWTDLPGLRELWCQCHRFLFMSDRDDREKRETIRAWPDVPQDLHAHALIFYAFLFLSGVDWLIAEHSARNIPLRVTTDTLRDIEIWIRDCHSKNGAWGLVNKGWISNHFFNAFFQLGRLQFNREVFSLDYHAFRNRSNGKVVVFAGDSQVFRPDGQFNGTMGIDDPDAWKASFLMTDSAIRGNIFSPYGKALPETVVLKRDDWDLILAKGDEMIGIHIPATGAMSHELCGDSFRQALDFFPRHFPEFRFKVFNCVSWFLDNQFAELLPEKSNIYQFLKEVYLYPVEGANDSQVFSRVFGQHYTRETIGQAPTDNSLRCLIVEHVRQGNHWHHGGCLLFAEDFDWGAEVYRKMNIQAETD